MKWLTVVAVLFVAAPVWAQQNTNTVPPRCTVATLAAGTCAPARMGARARISNTNVAPDTNCASGTGAVDQVCEYNGTNWVSSPVVQAGALDSTELATNSVDSAELSAFSDSVILCGENAENGTIYFGPSTGAFGGNGADLSQGGAACDALDNATEATADAPILAASAFKVLGFYCTTDATLGAGESIVFTLRSAEANLTPSLTCTIGEAATQCSEIDSTTTNVAAGATLAMSAVETGDNADGDESWCRVGIVIN